MKNRLLAEQWLSRAKGNLSRAWHTAGMHVAITGAVAVTRASHF